MFRSRVLATTALLLAGAAPAAAQELSRWVEVQTLSAGARYRVVEDGATDRVTEDLQDNLALKARVKTDKGGRLTVHVGAFTGTSATGSWNNTGWGSGARTMSTQVKQLYVAAIPVKGVEAQVGSLYAVRGESTEITTLDNDVYLTGERVSVRRPKQLYLDEVAFTNAYLGDLNTPDFFDRAGRFDEVNYRQVLVGKKFGPRVAASVDWTDAVSRTTWHGAVAVKLPRLVDAIRAEYYGRPDDGTSGGAVAAERKIVGKTMLSAGYANIDRDFGKLNGDRYTRGSRLFGGAALPLAGPLALSVYYTQGVGNSYGIPNARRFDLGLTWNVLATLQGALR